jgi:hypothetical protein
MCNLRIAVAYMQNLPDQISGRAVLRGMGLWLVIGDVALLSLLGKGAWQTAAESLTLAW